MNIHYEKLTKASIGHILEEKEIKQPIVQLVAYKNIVRPDGTSRYRLILSDGIFQYPCCVVLKDELQEKFANDEFDRYCLVKLHNYHLNKVDNRLVIVLNELEICVPGCEVGEKISNPITYGDQNAPSIAATYKPNYHLVEEMMASEFDEQDDLFWSSLSDLDFNNNNEIGNKRFKTNDGQALSSGSQVPRTLNANIIVPISSLTPYSFGWTISGRVVSKSQIKSWNNRRSSGVFFFFDIRDCSGEIRVKAFGNECSKFYCFINFDACYLISHGQVKDADKRYSNADYEINCLSGTKIENFDEAYNCPQISYEFVDFETISSLSPNTVIDLIGILVEIEELTIYHRKKYGKEGVRRNVELIDHTKNQIMLTIWDNYAKEFTAKLDDIIVIKNLNIHHFNSISLSTLPNTTIRVNPRMTQVNALRNWYNDQRIDSNGIIDIKRLTNKPTTQPAVYGTLSIITLDYVRKNQPPILVKCTITRIGRAHMYKACKSCFRRLTDLNGVLNCERCIRQTIHFDWKLMLQICLCDHTNELWCTAFSDVCMKLFRNDLDLKRLGELFETNYNDLIDQLSSILFKSFTFKLKFKINVYNEQEKLKAMIDDLNKVSIEYGRRLLDEIINSESVNRTVR